MWTSSANERILSDPAQVDAFAGWGISVGKRAGVA
jgi:hypothetical protein